MKIQCVLYRMLTLQQRMLEFNSEQKEYTTTTLLNDENKRFELKTVCQFYQEQIEQCKVLCKQKIRNSFLNPVFSIYTKYFIVPFYNLKSEFNTRIHYKSIQRSINIPENRIRYTSGIYSIKAGLPSVGEVFKVSIQ